MSSVIIPERMFVFADLKRIHETRHRSPISPLVATSLVSGALPAFLSSVPSSSTLLSTPPSAVSSSSPLLSTGAAPGAVRELTTEHDVQQAEWALRRALGIIDPILIAARRTRELGSGLVAGAASRVTAAAGQAREIAVTTVSGATGVIDAASAALTTGGVVASAAALAARTATLEAFQAMQASAIEGVITASALNAAFEAAMRAGESALAAGSVVKTSAFEAALRVLQASQTATVAVSSAVATAMSTGGAAASSALSGARNTRDFLYGIGDSLKIAWGTDEEEATQIDTVDFDVDSDDESSPLETTAPKDKPISEARKLGQRSLVALCAFLTAPDSDQGLRKAAAIVGKEFSYPFSKKIKSTVNSALLIADAYRHVREMPGVFSEAKETIDTLSQVQLVRLHPIFLVKQLADKVQTVVTWPLRYVYDTTVEPCVLLRNASDIGALVQMSSEGILSLADKLSSVAPEIVTDTLDDLNEYARDLADLLNKLGRAYLEIENLKPSEELNKQLPSASDLKTIEKLIRDLAGKRVASDFLKTSTLTKDYNPLRHHGHRTLAEEEIIAFSDSIPGARSALESLSPSRTPTAHASGKEQIANLLKTCNTYHIRLSDVARHLGVLETHATLMEMVSRRVLRPTFALGAGVVVNGLSRMMAQDVLTYRDSLPCLEDGETSLVSRILVPIATSGIIGSVTRALSSAPIWAAETVIQHTCEVIEFGSITGNPSTDPSVCTKAMDNIHTFNQSGLVTAAYYVVTAALIGKLAYLLLNPKRLRPIIRAGAALTPDAVTNPIRASLDASSARYEETKRIRAEARQLRFEQSRRANLSRSSGARGR